MLRPLRLLALGKEQEYTVEDQAFLRFVAAQNCPLVYQSPCPKNTGKPPGRRYLRYMHARTYTQAIELGSTIADFRWDYCHGFISFPKHEPQISGHVFNALELAAAHGYTHVLQDLGLSFQGSNGAQDILAHAFNVRGQPSFHRLLETVYEPEVILEEMKSLDTMFKLAAISAAKVLNSSTIKIDFRLAPEPTQFWEVQPEVCAEHDRWREAMDDEIASMVRFGVYRRLPKSAAGTRQILGCLGLQAQSEQARRRRSLSLATCRARFSAACL